MGKKKSKDKYPVKLPLDEWFTDNGSLIFDPYRNLEHEGYAVLFNEDGFMNDGVVHQIAHLINTHKWSWSCTAVGMLHAEKLAKSTKRRYSTIYYWR